MPWKKSEPMEERIEFALKAMGRSIFGRSAMNTGSVPRLATSGRSVLYAKGLQGMAENHAGPTVIARATCG